MVAGVRDDALLADLQSAVDDAIARGMPFNGWTDKDGAYREGFRDRFDQIVARHGWDHSMSAARRARVIYEANLATARAAGRVAQATDPAVRKAFPYWQYHHAHTRVPANPRERHEQWDGLILSADDKFWKTHTPPNGWRCSCGFTTLTAAKLKRLGKDAPDPSPAIGMRPIIDPSTGKLIEYPEGVDFGFAYQPGQDWSHGLAPKPLAGKPQDYRQLTLLTPKAAALPTGRAFKAPLLDETKIDDGEAITRFLRPFGPVVEGAVLFRDKAGQAIALSPQIFTRPDGSLKLATDRKRSLERLAETIIDPDEIWVRWEQNRKTGRWHLVRHYLRAAQGKGMFSVFRFGADGWDGVTAFPARPNYLDRYRTGRLLYRHEG